MSGIGKISEDLTGLTFGRLTVIKRAENIRGRTAWLCRCECGNMKTVLTKYLKNGSVQSCGCLRKEVQAEKAKNIAGFRFGKLTALRPSDKRDANGSVIWECRCDCGNIALISIAGLMSGNNISCGCAKETVKSQIRDRLDADEGTSINILSKRKQRKDNTSGYRGISKTKDGRYRVSIGFKGRKYYIGLYENYTDAVKKRTEAEELIHRGYLRAKKLWSGKDPLVYEVKKENGILRIVSSDVHENGNFMKCSLTEVNQSGRLHRRNYRTGRPHNRNHLEKAVPNSNK